MKRSPLIILFITIFIDLLGFGLVLPLIPVYITHYGGSSAVGGWLMASFSLMQFIFAPIWGRASDRYGRRPLILLSLIGSACSFLAFGLAHTLTVLFIARVAAGILTAASLPTAQAYIADVTPPEKRAGGMALIGAAFGLGFAFGPWIGGFLGNYSVFGQPSLATPAFFAAALSLLNFVLAYFILPESHTDRTENTREKKSVLDVFPTIGNALQNPAIRAQMLVFTFANFAFAAVESSFSWLVILRFQDILKATAAANWTKIATLGAGQVPQELRRLVPDGTDWAALLTQPFTALPPAIQQELTEKAATFVTGTIFGIVGITILIVQGAVMAGLARKLGEHRLVQFGTFLLTVSLIGIAFSPSLLLIQILSALIAIGNGVSNPSLSALITQSAGPKDRGTISGAQQGLGSLARIFAPPINNTLVGLHTPAPFLLGCLPFLSSAVLMSIAGVLSLRLRPLPASSSSELPVSGH